MPCRPSACAGLRAHHAVDHEPLLALEALDRSVGLRAENAVGGDAECGLDRFTVLPRSPRLTISSLAAADAATRSAEAGAVAPASASAIRTIIVPGASTRLGRVRSVIRRRTTLTTGCKSLVPLSNAYEVS